MRTVTYCAGAALKKNGDMLTLKTAMLMADIVLSACVIEANFEINRFYKEAAYNTKRKLIVLKAAAADDEEANKSIDDAIAFIKLYEKTKNKTPQMFSIIKGFEKKVDGMFKAHVEWIEEAMDKMGVRELQKLLDEKVDWFGFYPLHPIHVENSEGDMMPASEVLLSIGYPVDDGPEIFLLHPEFFCPAYTGNMHLYSVYDHAAAGVQHIYMDPLLSFPDLFEMKASEIKAIRNQLHEPGTAFRKAIDEWVTLALNNNNAQARMSFFKEQVIPASQLLQEAINCNTIITDYARQHKDSKTIHVMAGEIPPARVWDFYREYDAVAEETHKILEKERKDDPQYDDPFPVMAVRAAYLFGKDQDEAGDFEMKAVRKSISVD